MRPVDRGAAPQDAGGKPLIFRNYQEAREPLIRNVGYYCSYCEMPRPDGPDVEHVQPKARVPGRERDWDNLLLGCRNCNSTKQAVAVNLDNYCWPDRDNTFRAFQYAPNRAPAPALGLSPEQELMVGRTIRLTGLDRLPGHPRYSARDRRWIVRSEAWEVAQRSLDDLRDCNTPQLRRRIVDLAVAKGFWSVWMTVFAGDSDMCRRLREAFPGTAVNCWDDAGRPVQRPGGAI